MLVKINNLKHKSVICMSFEGSCFIFNHTPNWVGLNLGLRIVTRGELGVN